jgi:hypothetical protein
MPRTTGEEKALYQRWRDQLLWTVGHVICRNCTDPRSENLKLDYDNPLNCECRCEHVENILEKANNIDVQLRTSNDPDSPLG